MYTTFKLFLSPNMMNVHIGYIYPILCAATSSQHSCFDFFPSDFVTVSRTKGSKTPSSPRALPPLISARCLAREAWQRILRSPNPFYMFSLAVHVSFFLRVSLFSPTDFQFGSGSLSVTLRSPICSHGSANCVCIVVRSLLIGEWMNIQHKPFLWPCSEKY